MAEPFTSKKWRVWVQPDGPNTEIHHLGCITMDDLAENLGGIKDVIRCFKADGTGWETLGSTRNPPDPTTTTLTGLIEESANWLETILEDGNCLFPLYVNGKLCPPYDVFAGAERWYALEMAEFATSTMSGLAHREEENTSEQAFEVTAWPPLIRGHAILTDRIAFTGTENLNDIASCSVPRCPGDCGTRTKKCDMLVAVADGDPASADVWISFDNGVTWAATAVDPYLGLTTDLKSVLCFPVDVDTTRILVAREAVAGMPAHVYYSDDLGANWTDVTVGGVHGYGAVYGGALCMTDMYHIWLVTTDGADSQVWFSDDGGGTWTEQAIAAGVYYAVHFSDHMTGMIVGAADDVYVTIDGGLTWDAATATGSGDDLLTVEENAGGDIWWVGSDDGDIWYSTDHGTTWVRRDFPGDSAGAVYGIDFATPTVGYMVHSPTAATGLIYRTRNGGYTWEAESAVYAGELYSVLACHVNKAFAVGEVDTTALVLRAHN